MTLYKCNKEKKGDFTMNNTIKYLLEREISRWIVVIYDNQSTIDKIRVDVKNGYIRFWECKTVTHKLPIKDLGITEDEVNEIIKNVTLNSVFAFSEYPVTENFKTK